MRPLRVVLVFLLCLPLMGQMYNTPFAPRGGTPLSALIFGGSRNDLPDATATYYALWGGVVTDDDTIANAEQVISAPGNFTAMRIGLSADIGPNNDDSTWTLQIDGVDTALTCPIDGTGGTQDFCEVAATVHVDAGDRVVLEVVTLNTPQGIPGWSFHFTSDNSDEQNLLGHYDSTNTANARHGTVTGSFAAGDFDADKIGTLVAIDGTIKNLQIATDVCPGAGASRVYTVQINGSDTDPIISCTLSGASPCGDGATDVCADTATEADAVSAGDYITIEDVPASTPVTMETSVGLTFITGTTDKFIFGFASTDAPLNSGVEYAHISGESLFGSTVNTRESPAQRAFTVTDMRVLLKTAPGTSESLVITLTDDGIDTSPIVECTVSGTAFTCGTPFSGTTAIADNGEIALETAPSASATTGGGVLIGLAGTVP